MLNRFRSSPVAKTLVVGAIAFAAIVAVAALVSTPADAVSTPGITSYYKESTYKTLVGQETYGCCGEYSSWGQKTKYRKFERFYCLDVLCPF